MEHGQLHFKNYQGLSLLLASSLLLAACSSDSHVREAPPMEKAPASAAKPATPPKPNALERLGDAAVDAVSAPSRWMNKPATPPATEPDPSPPQAAEGAFISRSQPTLETTTPTTPTTQP